MRALIRHSKRRPKAQVLGFVLALLSMPLALQAQEEQPRVPEQAQVMFDEAVADYMAKRWDQAALKFRKAYAVVPEAVFLYNQAKALQKLENYQAAVSALTRARDQEERPLPPELVAKVPAFLAELETSLAAEKAAAEEKAATAEVVPQAVLPQAVPPNREEGFGTLGWTGVGTLVAGSGLMVFGGILAADVAKEADRLENEAGQTPGQFQTNLQAAQSHGNFFWTGRRRTNLVHASTWGLAVWLWRRHGEENVDYVCSGIVGAGRV